MSNLNRKLLLISYDYPPSTGGIARLCHEIVSNLKTHYKQVEILTIDKEIISNTYNKNEEVKANKLPRKRGLAELKALHLLLQWKNKKNTDVICGTWHPEASLALLAGFKNVYTLAHGTELLYGNNTFRKNIWLPIYAKPILKKSKAVIANSNYTKNLVTDISKTANVIALPLGVNTAFFKPNKNKDTGDTLKICTVSRILQFKGHDFILDTLCMLPEFYRNQIEWHIAGTGPYLNELKTLVHHSTLANQIQFHGFVQDQDLPDFYNSNDVFILATRQTKNSTQVEGFGLVFLEAQSCGLPVIGTNTGGIPDAIENDNGGWMIEQDQTNQLSNKIKMLIDHPEILQKQADLARQRAIQECSWQHYTERLFNFMQ